MGAKPLARRRAQLELLAAACDGGHLARLAVRTPETTTTRRIRFLALEPDALVISWPGVGEPASGLEANQEVEVYFEHCGERFAFNTRPRNQCVYGAMADAGVSAWKLSLPLRIDRRQQREHFRVALRDQPPLMAQLVPTHAAESRLWVQLTNISCGGFGARFRWSAPEHWQVGGLFWTSFALPYDSAALEFVARLVHWQRDTQGDAVDSGWAFCGGEGDPEEYAHKLTRLRRFIARRRRELKEPALTRWFHGSTTAC